MVYTSEWNSSPINSRYDNTILYRYMIKPPSYDKKLEIVYYSNVYIKVH